jgi:hypothetical protein
VEDDIRQEAPEQVIEGLARRERRRGTESVGGRKERDAGAVNGEVRK